MGDEGVGTLNITNGGSVCTEGGSIYGSASYIGNHFGSTGTVSVSGNGSTWTCSNDLLIGLEGGGTLSIDEGGLVSVAETLSLDPLDNGLDSSINMSTGGMLALAGEADDSLTAFLDLVEGTDAIRFWDDSLTDWALLTTATMGLDYTLEYLTTGDLTGYTLLTVAVPEPSTILLLLSAIAGLLVAQRRK